MTKKDIIDIIYQNSTYKKSDIADIVDQTFDVIITLLKNNESVAIRNFGTFQKVYYKEYYLSDPNTGEKVLVPSSYRVSLVSSAKLKQAINSQNE